MKKKICLVLAAALFSVKLFSQTLSPEMPFLLNLDYARFLYDDKSGYLEIYYGFHPHHVSFNYTDNKFQGGVILSTKIMNKKTKKFVVNNHSLLKIAENDTGALWYQYPFINKFNYIIPNGDYILEVTAADSLGSSRIDSIKLELKIAPSRTKLNLSDIELCKNIMSSDKNTDQFFKNSLEVVPYPSLIFGSVTIPAMFYYIELYNLETDADYIIKTEIINSNGSTIRQKRTPKKFPSANSIDVGTLPTTSYSSGTYIFRFTILDDSEDVITKADKLFYIYNPHIEMALQKSLALDRKSFKDMTDEELSQEFDYAGYLTTDLEEKIFEGLELNKAKSDFLFDFWFKVSKGRAEYPLIKRFAYLQRARTADQRFKIFGKKGWQSDQGRIFMIYSEPDEIERIPSNSDTNPYEIWRYFDIESGVEFIFIDMGYGAHRLVHSTKRGELQDINWQQYLR